MKAKFFIEKKKKGQGKSNSEFDSGNMFDKDISRINQHTPGKNQNDVSKDMLEDYQKMINSLAKDPLYKDEHEIQRKMSGNKVQVYSREPKQQDKASKGKIKKTKISPQRDSISMDDH